MKTNLELRGGACVLTATACALLLAPLAASGGEAMFEVSLSGPEASGDPNGQGEATVTLDAEANEVDVHLSHSDIAEPTMMFIREGKTGTAGNVVIPVVLESDGEGVHVGRRQSAKPGIVEMILASPDEYYLVVMNDEHPVGALRGGPLQE